MTVIDYADGWLDPIAGESQYQFQQRIDTFRNNGGQMAHVGFAHETTGAGDFPVGTAVSFGVQFAGKPTISYGNEIIKFPDPAHYHYPRGSASVYQWVLDEKGFYVGAKIVYSVDCPPQGGYLQGQLALLNARIDVAYRKGQLDAAFAVLLLANEALPGDENEPARAPFMGAVEGRRTAVTQAQTALVSAQSAANAAVPSTSSVVVHHNLMFYGMALKKLPDALMSAMDTIASSSA